MSDTNFRFSGVLAHGHGPDRRVCAVYVRLEDGGGYVLAGNDPHRLLGRISDETTLAELGDILARAWDDEAGDEAAPVRAVQ